MEVTYEEGMATFQIKIPGAGNGYELDRFVRAFRGALSRNCSIYRARHHKGGCEFSVSVPLGYGETPSEASRFVLSAAEDAAQQMEE